MRERDRLPLKLREQPRADVAEVPHGQPAALARERVPPGRVPGEDEFVIRVRFAE